MILPVLYVFDFDSNAKRCRDALVCSGKVNSQHKRCQVGLACHYAHLLHTKTHNTQHAHSINKPCTPATSATVQILALTSQMGV